MLILYSGVMNIKNVRSIMFSGLEFVAQDYLKLEAEVA